MSEKLGSEKPWAKEDFLGFPGVVLITTPVHEDERGYLYESYSHAKHSPSEDFVLDLMSYSSPNVFRGLHYQVGRTRAQAKLIRCLFGEMCDVFVDLREGSPTYMKSGSVFLYHRTDEAESIYLPIGFAHGYFTSSSPAMVHYKCTAYHDPEAERSLKYFGVREDAILSQRDRDAGSPESYIESPSFRWKDGVTTCL